MSKESFSQRVDFQKQQIKLQNESAKKARIDRQNLEVIEYTNKKAQEEAAKQKEINERITKTKEIFKNSGIIEVLEEIRDEEILINSKKTVGMSVKKMFGSKWINSEVITPAEIDYNFNFVSLQCNTVHHDGSGDYGDPWYSFDRFTVKKNDSNDFTFIEGNSNESGSSNIIIDKIANFVARKAR